MGEFDQKSTIRTKYGTRNQYLAAIKSCHESGIQIYADVVFNHRDGGDETEFIKAISFARDNRNYPLGGVEEIEAYTHFTFPGRGKKYSSMKWKY